MEDVLNQIETSTTEDIALTFVPLFGPSISSAINTLNENIENIPGIKSITGELLGRYDYAFEWLRVPDEDDIIGLVDAMDSILKESGVIYNIATKSKLKKFKDYTVEPSLQKPVPTSFVTRRIF